MDKALGSTLFRIENVAFLLTKVGVFWNLRIQIVSDVTGEDDYTQDFGFGSLECLAEVAESALLTLSYQWELASFRFMKLGDRFKSEAIAAALRGEIR